MIHTELRCEYVDWMKETEIRIQWLAVVSNVVNLLLP
jgi:hypothetical protein